MHKNDELNNLKQVLITKIKSENDLRYVNLSANEIMKIIHDSGLDGKYSLWTTKEYLKNNIQRFEDMGRVKQALTLFKNNLSKFDNSQKQLNKMSFKELENLVSPYQDVLTQKAVKRMQKEKIWSEIEVVYEGVEGRICVPKSQQAAMFLGQGTKWCTASTEYAGLFDYYNEQGPLYVFVLPEKDSKGREIKYQLHIESNQFMDSEDIKCDLIEFENKSGLIDKLFNTLTIKQKIEFMIKNEIFFSLFSKNEYFSDFADEIFLERVKSFDLEYIVSENLTPNLCRLIIEHAPKSFKLIPEDMRTQELCEFAVKEKGLILSFVPEKFRTQELCEIAATKNGNDLRFVPEKFRTQELWEIVIEKSNYMFSSVPEILKTYEFCKKAVTKNGSFLKDVSDNFKTKELCEVAVKNKGISLIYVPDEFRTKKLCELAVKNDGKALAAVPINMRTKKLCELAIKQNGIALNSVPSNLITQDLCELAVQQNGNAIEYIQKEFMNNKICEIAVSENGSALKFIPTELITKEICKISLRNSYDASIYIPDELMTTEMYSIGLEDIRAFRYMPDDLLTPETKKNAVRLYLMKHNLDFSFEETIKMMFDGGENPVKNSLSGFVNTIRRDFASFYIDIISTEIEDKLKVQNTHLFQKQ